MAGEHILFAYPDQAVVNLLIRKFFAPLGYKLSHAATGEEALRILRAQQPDVLVVGEQLDLMKGLDLIRQVTLERPGFPVVLLTEDKISEKTLSAALQAGAIGCLNAPLQPDELRHALKQAVKRSQAYQAAHSTQSASNLKALHRQLDELERVRLLGQTLTSQLDLDSVLIQLLKAAVEMTGAEEGSILLLDKNSGDLKMRAAYNFNDEFVRTFRLPSVDTLAGQVIQTGQPLVLGRNSPEKIKTHYLVQSLLYVPLKIQGKVIGVLGVDNRTQTTSFQDQHIRLISSLADYAAIAIENAQLYQQLALERNELETTLSQVADGVVVIDPDNKMVFANPIARRFLQFSEFSPGISVEEAIHHDGILSYLWQARSGQPMPRAEFQLGEGFYVEAQVTSLPDVGLILSLHNITHFKELDTIKTEFINTISHDLRSPMTAILGYIELIQRAGPISPQQQEYIKRVQSSVTNITNLINTLLELGKIESGLDFQPVLVHISSIIYLAAEEIQPLIAKKKQTLHIEIPSDLPPIQGDPARLRRLVINLLENACKYTPEEGKITCSCFSEGNNLHFQVEDNGMGILPTDQPYIFNKLYRGINIPEYVDGVGLGLSIVKSIVEAHKGQLWFEPSQSGGAIFHVTLPQTT